MGPSSQQYSLYTTTELQYDLPGNLMGLVDAEGNQTRILYNSLSQKIAMGDPDMGCWTYAYDRNGNLRSRTDARGNTVTFEYDGLRPACAGASAGRRPRNPPPGH